MKTLYCRYSDILTTFASVGLASGTQSTDATYQLAALSAWDLSRPFKTIDAPPVAVRITWDHGSATRLDAVAIPKHNCDASLAVRFQRNATNAWTTPSQDVALTIGARRPGTPGHSRSPWVDLRSQAGYLVGGYRYSSLYIPANSVAPQLKAFLIGTLRTFEGIVEGSTVVPVHGRGYIPSVRTAYGVRSAYDMNVVQRAVQGALYAVGGDWQALQDLSDDCGGCVRPFFFVLDDSVTDDGGLLVQLSEAMAAGLSAPYVGGQLQQVGLDLVEVSRGLPL